MLKSNKKKLKKSIYLRIIIIAVLIIACVALAILIFRPNFLGDDNSMTATHKSDIAKKRDKAIVPNAQTPEYSTDEAGSIWVVVNKGRILPLDYVPLGLVNPVITLTGPSSSDNMKMRSDAASALGDLGKAAEDSAAPIRMTSGYRSYDTQSSLYSGYVANQGVNEADKTSARPGHSEHQTGLAVDVEPLDGKCSLSECFANTSAGIWVAKHAHEYGFIVRYQKNTTDKTGYAYEPWHLRYVGKQLALTLYDASQTLEEYFGLPFYADYPQDSYQLRE